VATKRVGLLFVVALLVAGCGAKESTRAEPAGAARSLPGLTPEKIKQLREWSIQNASEMGDDHPEDGIILETTQHHFYELTDGTRFGTPDFKAFVVAYRGNFTAYNAPRPYGTQAPRGHHAYVVYHADTLRSSDSGVGDFAFDPGKIGPWIPLDLEH